MTIPARSLFSYMLGRAFQRGGLHSFCLEQTVPEVEEIDFERRAVRTRNARHTKWMEAWPVRGKADEYRLKECTYSSLMGYREQAREGVFTREKAEREMNRTLEKWLKGDVRRVTSFPEARSVKLALKLAREL